MAMPASLTRRCSARGVKPKAESRAFALCRSLGHAWPGAEQLAFYSSPSQVLQYVGPNGCANLQRWGIMYSQPVVGFAKRGTEQLRQGEAGLSQPFIGLQLMGPISCAKLEAWSFFLRGLDAGHRCAHSDTFPPLRDQQ